MPVSPASVSAERPPADAATVLIVGVNWLGDSLMTLPALQAYRRRHPAVRLILLVKPKLAAFWSLCPITDEVWTCPDSIGGILRIVPAARRRNFQAAYILPHSFRSALVPFLARVPDRAGLPGHGRDWMLTRIIRPVATADRRHQAYEFLDLMAGADEPLPAPRLTVGAARLAAARRRLGTDGGSWVGLFPGAAFGPEKRWPAEHFAAVGRQLQAGGKYRIVVLGALGEKALCAQVAQAIGPAALNLAGATSLPDLAAILANCALAIGNDSGGLHLAAAMGTPVVAIFGVTDPDKTAPLGAAVCVVQDSPVRRRDIQCDVRTAAGILKRVKPEQVLAAADSLLQGQRRANV